MGTRGDCIIRYNDSSKDCFDIYSEWYYCAILNLFVIKSFQADELWIADKLGIKVSIIKDALDKLLEEGYLFIDSKIGFKLNEVKFQATDFRLTQLSKKVQKSFIHKTFESITKTDLDKMSTSAIIIPMSSDKIPFIKERIKAFNDEMLSICNSEKKEELYLLNLTLTPLT